MPRSDSTPPPTPEETQRHWDPRLRGALTLLAGTLVYCGVATAFGTSASMGTALVGMFGSLSAMAVVWWLEARRAARYHRGAGATDGDGGTT